MKRVDRSNRLLGRGTIGILASLVLFASACAPESADVAEEPRAAGRGEQVFDENCGVCHGPGGRGPALTELKALSSADRRDRIRNHPIAGQIPQRLPAHQLSDVIEFLESN